MRKNKPWNFKWTDEEIEIELRQIIEKYNFKTFPTHSEIQKLQNGSHALTVAISRHGGTKYWAKRMNLPIKPCESKLGDDYEMLALKLLKEKFGLDGKQTIPRYPYDLLVGSGIKIDVKVGRMLKMISKVNKSVSYQNSFNLEKKDPTCDVFIIFCLNEKEDIYKTLIIPSPILAGLTQVGVGENSHWDIYKDKWEYIALYEDFYKKIKGGVTDVAD